MTDVRSAKSAIRRDMRALRKRLPDRAERSDLIWQRVRTLAAVRQATTVMVFSSVEGEPITEPFIAWCRSQAKTVVLPEDEPLPDPAGVDVVIVPGTAFTPRGDRLGQGGGWYDRFLGGIRPDCTTVGVGFEPQVLPELPTEPHDVRLGHVVTDGRLITC